MCAADCLCRDIGHNATVCRFDTHDVDHITAEVLFDSPAEYIRNLSLEFISNEKNSSLKFPFKAFFLLGFRLLTVLYIINDNQILNDGALFRMDELQFLPQLSTFSFHGGKMELAKINMSVKLNLRYLDVSFSRHITFDQLCNIVKISGEALEEVYADSINDYVSRGEFSQTNINDSFFSCFKKTRLRVFRSQRSNINQISSPKINLFVPFLEIIDVSHNFGDIDILTYFGMFQLDKLRKLIISDFPIIKRKQKQNCEIPTFRSTRYDNPFCRYFVLPSVRMFNSLEVSNFGANINCLTTNTFACEHQSQCIFPKNTVLRELYLDNICIIRMDMHISGLNRLEKLDFSSNQCEYMSSLVFFEMKSLKILLLNGNLLSKMEETDPEELRILFRENSNLRYLNLSANGFTRLHSDIFKTNRMLESLDLSENFLHNTNWLSGTLMQLRSLNLKGNRLKTIDSRTRDVIDKFGYGYKYSVGEMRGIQINLANNPIICDCDQEDLLRWLSRTKRYLSNIKEIVCADGGVFLYIYTDDIESYVNSCNFTRYKGLIALCIIPFIVAICVVLYVRYYRNILRIRRIRKHLNEFAQDNFPVLRRFLLYLAYSFSDSDIVLHNIYPELEGRLQKEVGEKDNLVCISDRDFDVGVSISDEIIHAIASSSAVLFIISKEFARSRWCEFEAEIALYQEKPMILVVLGDLKVRSLPSSLRKVCFKWTRLEWPSSENQAKLEEFWNKLIKAIIKHTTSIRL
ncbi:hypothetical protein CHS0354_019592 [Potamilus streckersoni]|uniref:TIR domain-containing protein n=1 Tax=Potamilus streckersoni TaxID=2493646 RepID=A0AAE0TH45_9BIVA|nr:hypothetical protein CHS0354_019592 [Potamilus streckersoni]